jgi:uncharacterized membrane protein
LQWKNASHLFFAVTFIGIGVMGAIKGGFGPIWGGVPKSFPDRQLLAYLSTFVSLACGAALLVKRTASPAALVLLVFLTVWTALFKIPFIVRAPLVEVSYQTCGENAVLIAAAWVLFAGSAKSRTFPAGNSGVRVARALYGLALIAFGLSHFVYLDLTAPLVPRWLPGHVFWAYFTGSIYLATGLALVTSLFARLAAFIAAVQIALITLLVWGPVILAGHVSSTDWQEAGISWALTAGACAMAASFEGSRWLSQAAVGGFALRRLARG